MEKKGKAAKQKVVLEVAPPAADTKSYLDHLKKINDVFYDQIKIADQKAAYIFTFMLAFLISSAEGRSVFSWQNYQSGDAVTIILSGCLAPATVVSLVAAILVVLPRTRGKATSLYWGAWTANRELFVQAANGGDPNYLMQEYLGNVDNLSSIAASKYRFVSLSFRGLIVTLLAYVLLLTLG